MKIGTIRRDELQPIQDGTLISGTHRPEDLIPELGEALGYIYSGHWREDVAEARDYAKGVDVWRDNWAHEYADHMSEDEMLSHLLESLFYALDEVAPDGMYFGAHPGDGSDFGFWAEESDE